MRLWDSCIPSDTGRHSGRARRVAVHAALVQAVPHLVQRGEQRCRQVPGAVAGREADVGGGEGGRERVRGVVQAPGARRDRHPLQEREHGLPLARDVEAVVEEGVVDRPGALQHRAGERQQRVLQLTQQALHLGRLHSGLEVVEQHVVGVVHLGEAVHVAPAQLDVAPQVRQQQRVVVAVAGLAPGVLAGRRSAREVRLEVGRHAPGLLVIAARDADQAGLGGVVRQRLFVAAQFVQEAADLVRRQPVVLHPHQRGELVCARGGATRRHLGALVPGKHGGRPVEVVHLGQALAQLAVASRLHTAKPIGVSGPELAPDGGG